MKAILQALWTALVNMSKGLLEKKRIADPHDHSTPAAPSVEERVAKIEGQIASSWAFYTKAEYEMEFRDKVKREVVAYVTNEHFNFYPAWWRRLLVYVGSRR